ncbi:MAG: MIP/aquaporin family protein [Ferrimicrobium sp.]
MDDNSMVQKLLSEVIGTAFLVFIGVGSIPAMVAVNGTAPFTYADLGMISLAFGTVVVATVYCLGHISGNHINPAVTFGLAVTGKFPWKDVPGYLIAQLVGATIGAFAIIGTLGSQAWKSGLGVAAYHTGVSGGRAFVAELIGTFILVFVVFGVIHRKAPLGWAGLVIGFVVFAVIMVVAPATSSAINPARVLGPMLVLQIMGGTVHWSQAPVYISAELLGGVLAALVYTMLVRTPADSLVMATES